MSADAQVVRLGEGREATYETIGDGPPLLTIVGGPGLPASLMRSDASLLADRFRCYLIDPHGSGGSTPPREGSDYDHAGHARFYDEVRRALGLGNVSVLGVSFGGTVALTYAAMYPDVVDRCIAVSAAGTGIDVDAEEGGAAAAEMERMLSRHSDQPWYTAARQVMDAWTERVLGTDDVGELEEMTRIVWPFYFAHPERTEVASAIDELRVLTACDLAASKFWEGGLYQTIDIRPLLKDIRCPVLVICGELDFICGPAQAASIISALPDAELVPIPDCGHVPSIEAPEEYRSAVLEFCGKT
jgi:proline iminopeptidase